MYRTRSDFLAPVRLLLLSLGLAGVLATILVILAIGILIELVVFAPFERRMLRSRGLLQGGTR